MQITKYTHSCVRMDRGRSVLVVDPGAWGEPEALAGADAVLLTHEHADHVDIDRLTELTGLGLPVYAPDGTDIPGLEFTAVRSGEVFTAAGFEVRAVGGRHAVTYAGQPECANLGYVVDDSCYHPGDSLHVPDVPVDTLFVPIQGAWLKTSEAIDFVHAIKPRRTFAIHDAQVNDRGLASLNGWFAQETDAAYHYLAPHETA